MTPIDFIKNWISRNNAALLIESALYEFDSYSETHFLKLTPGSLIINPDYENILSELIISFDRHFQDGGLCLINEESLTKLENTVELIQSGIPSIAPFVVNFEIQTKFIPLLSKPFTLPNSFNWHEITTIKMDFAKEFHSAIINFKYASKVPDHVPISEVEPVYFPDSFDKLSFSEEQPINKAA